MPRSSSPRKKYIRRPDDSVLLRFSEEDEREFQLGPHVQLANLVHGRADSESWDALELRIKWGMTLAKSKGLGGAAESAGLGFNELLDVHDSFVQGGSYDVTESQTGIIGDSLILVDELQLKATKRELRDALNLTLSALRTKPAVGRRNCFA